MAVVATLKMSGVSANPGQASFATASGSFAAGSLVVALLGVVDGGNANLGANLTVAGGSLTYTSRAVTGAAGAANRAQGRIWSAPFAAGGSLTLTFDCGADFILAGGWFVYEVTGHDTTTPTSGGIGTPSTTNDGSFSVTLTAAPASADVTLAMVFLDGNTSGTIAVTPGASPWVEVGEVGNTTVAAYGQSQQRTTSTSTTVNWVDLRAGTMTTFSSAGLAVNVLVAAGGTTTVSTTRATTWNTQAAVSATRATTWNVAAAVAATRATTWNVKAAVVATRATTWNVSSSVAATRATTWNTTTAVTATRTTTWNTAGSVATTRATTWVTRTAVIQSRATTWNTQALVTTTRATTWNVASALTAVSTSRATTWNTRAPVTATRATTWNVTGSVTTARSTTWAVLTVAATTRATTWVTRSTVAVSRSTTWNVAAPVVLPDPTIVYPVDFTVGPTVTGVTLTDTANAALITAVAHTVEVATGGHVGLVLSGNQVTP